MASKERYIKYTISEDTTLSSFLSDSKSLISSNLTKEEFLKFKDENNKSNADLIYAKYSKKDQNTQAIKDKYSQYTLETIKANTTLSIPISEYQEQLFVIGGDNLFLDQSQDLPAYLVEKDKELRADSKYVKAEILSQTQGNVNVKTIEENCQVWLYVKSIDKLIDISPFITSLTISKTDIGNFSINLNPIEIEISRESNDITGVFVSSQNGSEYLNDYEVKKIDGTLNISFFEKYCQQNDAIFIRFEKLQLENDYIGQKFGSHGIEVSKQSLPDQIFDMIGLVDSISSSINTEASDYSVNISGRDFMKMLVEDGSYLIDLTFAEGSQNMFFYLGDSSSKYFKRNFVSNGAFQYLFKEYFDPIQTYMGFIVNQLSNVGWTGDNDLFDYYLPSDDKIGDPDKRKASAYRIGISNESTYLENVEVNGAWKICKIKIDPNLNDRRVIDGSFIDQDGTLYEQFKKVCQTPFVEFWGDTYGSQFNFIARQQPFDKKGMANILNNNDYIIDVEESDTFQINLGWETEFYSWFQFFPNNQAFGDDKFYLASNFPIIYLDKFVENFGNHKLVIQDNYVNGKSVDPSKGERNKESIARGLFNDLKYAIESYSVLPFTRRGTVVINGDRRIKKGSFIRLKATGEICYVDAVSNSVSFLGNSVNRTTTLSLRRCMFEDYLLKTSQSVLESGAEEYYKYDYYKIVDSDMIISELLRRYEGNIDTGHLTKTQQQIKTNFGVNEDVFNFFLERKQMDLV